MLVRFIATNNEMIKWHVVFIPNSGDMTQLFQRPLCFLQEKDLQSIL